MEISNGQLLQLIGQKEVDNYALRLQLAEAQKRIEELTDENVSLKSEVKNGE